MLDVQSCHNDVGTMLLGDTTESLYTLSVTFAWI